MAKIIKGSKRYILLRGTDELGNDIVIDVFDKKTLDKALQEGRISPEDNIFIVQVLEKAELKKAKSAGK